MLMLRPLVLMLSCCGRHRQRRRCFWSSERWSAEQTCYKRDVQWSQSRSSDLTSFSVL